MDSTLKITIPYTPRPLQKYISDHLKRFSVLVVHRRFGKTVMCVLEIIKQALKFNGVSPLTGKKLTRPQYLYVTPEKSQAKKIAWQYFKEMLISIPGVHYNNNELVITLPNKATIYLDGAEDPNRHRGMYFDGIVLDEYAQMPTSLWDEVLRPALSDRKGWVIFIGTVKGENKFWEMYQHAISGIDPNWYGQMFKAGETGYVAREELAEARRSMTDAAYRQEYECDPKAAIKGAYFADALEFLYSEKRINEEVIHDPSRICFTAWDLGMNDKTCIWFIEQGEESWSVIDYYENSGKDLGHYAKVILAKPYVYAKHILPHDAAVRSLSTGMTRKQHLSKLGLSCAIAKKLPIMDSINAAVGILYKCKFNESKCRKGLEALRQYRAEYNDKLEVFKPTPLHDKHSHAADAFRSFATGITKNLGNSKRKQSNFSTGYDPLTNSTYKTKNRYDPLG